MFHDDQHGTAIISAAALLNGVELQGKKIEDVKVVFSGAGASAISCAKLYKDVGVKSENILMCDSRGVMYKGRGEGYNKYKEEFVAETDRRTLEDALVEGAAGRLRPKLMTVVCLMAGLAPLLWSQGVGADVMKRVAAPMFGGLASSFVLELAVLPALYAAWARREVTDTPAIATFEPGVPRGSARP